MSARRTPNAQRGAALLLVIWLVALLAALVGAFAFSARIEHIQGRVLYRGVVADQAARAGLEYAMLRLADRDPLTAWVPDGRSYDWEFAGMPVQVQIVDERGKIDLNVAEQTLLAALMVALGADETEAQVLAAAIEDWRDEDDLGQLVGSAEAPQYAAAGLPYGPRNAWFETVSELELVLGMPADLAARMAPHVTVHNPSPVPDQRWASGPVLQAMGLDPEVVEAMREPDPMLGPDQGFVAGGSGTYSIDSLARLPDGRRAQLQAVVRAGGTALPGAAYVSLRWKEGASAPDD
ncbi:type II secretion system minor pseudopilin [Luteimonas qiangzhengi]|uniref:general secretion pathway protein GspK n=1 Tax=Luteimonas sp. MJ146 TaxID=3129240 RepID=UPI0031BB57E5